MVDVLSKLTSQSEKEEAERARKLLTSLRGTVSKPVEGKKALLLHFSMRLGKDWETEEPERNYKSDSDEDEEESKDREEARKTGGSSSCSDACYTTTKRRDLNESPHICSYSGCGETTRKIFSLSPTHARAHPRFNGIQTDTEPFSGQVTTV